MHEEWDKLIVVNTDVCQWGKGMHYFATDSSFISYNLQTDIIALNRNDMLMETHEKAVWSAIIKKGNRCKKN